MSTAANDRRELLNGDGSITSFSYGFKIRADADLEVYIIVTAALTTTIKTLGAHYTVTGAGDAGGGTVVFVTAPASGEQVLILGREGQTQPDTLIPGQDSAQETFDRIVRLVQQVQEVVTRAPRFEKRSALTNVEIVPPVAADDDKRLVWDDANSQYIHAVASSAGSLTTTSLGESILAAATAGAVLDLLNVTAFMQTVLDDTTAALARRTLATDEIVMLGDDDTDDVVEKVSITPTADVTWTGVDITADVRAGHTARYAILRVFNQITAVDAAASRSSIVSFRRTGNTTQTKFQVARCAIGAGGGGAPSDRNTIDRQVIVPLSAGESFDYMVDVNNPFSGFNSVIIDLEGYIR